MININEYYRIKYHKYKKKYNQIRRNNQINYTNENQINYINENQINHNNQLINQLNNNNYDTKKIAKFYKFNNGEFIEHYNKDQSNKKNLNQYNNR